MRIVIFASLLTVTTFSLKSSQAEANGKIANLIARLNIDRPTIRLTLTPYKPSLASAIFNNGDRVSVHYQHNGWSLAAGGKRKPRVKSQFLFYKNISPARPMELEDVLPDKDGCLFEEMKKLHTEQHAQEQTKVTQQDNKKQRVS